MKFFVSADMPLLGDLMSGLTTNWVTLLDILSFLDPHLYNNTRHRGTNGPRIARSFLAGDSLDGRVLIFNGHSANLYARN